jgi:Spy/CpxP family protein refolding chaperone
VGTSGNSAAFTEATPMKPNAPKIRTVTAQPMWRRLSVLTLAATFGIGTLSAQTPKAAVDPATHAAHVAAGTHPAAADSTKGDAALAQQISQLQAKVAQLEAVLVKNAPPMAATPGMGMGMGKMKSGMQGMSPDATPTQPMAGMGDTDAPPGEPMNMMRMMDRMMGMMDKMMSMGGGEMGMDMGKMKMGAMSAAPGMGNMGRGDTMMGMMGMGGSAVPMAQSALPGFPGASHLYHVGSTGFFLDHPQHIALTTEQQAALSNAREAAMLAQSTADRAIKQAEQALWSLTASDQPDAAQIEAKIREIEKLRGDQRLAFIRAVGEASRLLTDEQRKILTGFAPPAPAAAPMAPMKGM